MFYSKKESKIVNCFGAFFFRKEFLMSQPSQTNSSQNQDEVYVLEGEPNEVFNAQGQPIPLTPEEEKEVEAQI